MTDERLHTEFERLGLPGAENILQTMMLASVVVLGEASPQDL